jgi:hypothetical protein
LTGGHDVRFGLSRDGKQEQRRAHEPSQEAHCLPAYHKWQRIEKRVVSDRAGWPNFFAPLRTGVQRQSSTPVATKRSSVALPSGFLCGNWPPSLSR